MTDDPTDDAAARLAALEAKLATVEADAAARVLQAELRAEAVRAGMIDLDGIKLIDTAALRAGDDLRDGIATVMRDLRRAKPWLFAAASSSSTAPPPRTDPPKPKRATEMTDDEWRAARAELIRRH